MKLVKRVLFNGFVQLQLKFTPRLLQETYTVYTKYSMMTDATCKLLLIFCCLRLVFCQTCNWVYQGCWKDNSSRLFPTQISPYTFHAPQVVAQFVSAWDCQQAAAAAGYNTVGLQYGGQCFAGNNPLYTALGAATACSQGTAPNISPL